MLDRVIHAAYVVVCFLIKSDIGQKQWKRYLDHHSGRHDFQIDLALSVMNYGISLQWDGESDKIPNFMRQNHFVPCDCNKGFFCLNGITTGIAHPPMKKAKVTVEYKCETRVTTNNCTGESWDGIGELLPDVLQKATHYRIEFECKGEEEDKQNICYGMSNLQGAYLQRVLERGVR
jgi:hypothetical protein